MGTDTTSPATSTPAHPSTARLVVSWAVVGVPLVYGISQTLVKAAKLFTG